MSEGGWGEGKLTARGGRWKGKERKFSPPIVHRALAFFLIIVSFNAIPRGSLPEERC